MAKRRSNKKKRSYTLEKYAVGFMLGIVAISTIVEAIANNPATAAGVMIVVGIIVVALFVSIWSLRRRKGSKQRRRSLEHARHLGQLLTVSGQDFEIIIRDLFLSMGYRELERIGGSGDLGVDLTGLDPYGLPIIVQCKRYGVGQKIGSPAIQALMGAVVHNGAHKGIFVTTSAFTKPALEHAKHSRIRIELIDGISLTQLASEASRKLSA